MTQNIPAYGSNIARKDINEIYKWKIDDLYADKESWQAAAQNLKAELSRFEEFKGRLGEAQILLQALHACSLMPTIPTRLYRPCPAKPKACWLILITRYHLLNLK